MTARHLGILSVFLANLLSSQFMFAQTPAPTPLYTGNLGGGFALTSGNTDTKTFNITAGLVRDPKTKHVTKGNASYFRGTDQGNLNLDRSAFNVRHEYTLSGRTFVFGQTDYLRDKFKEIIFLWVPSGGVGYKLVNNDSTQLIVDGGLGGYFEKNPGKKTSKAGSVSAGQRFQHKLSSATTFTQSLGTIWKTTDFSDSLTNFSVGMTTTVVGKIQLKVEFLDSYKNKPARIGLKKNDTAFVTAFIVKF